MQTTHTSTRSATSEHDGSSRRWTVRSSFVQSSPRARVVAAVAAVLAVGCTFQTHIPVTTGIVVVCLLPAVLVDIIDRRLPNRLIAGAASIGVIALIIEALVADVGIAPADLALGAAAMAGPPLVVHLAVPTAMGFGDVKAALVAGAALGLVEPVIGLVALAIGSAGAALIGLARHRHAVAFGPGIVGGAIVALILVTSPVDPIGQPGDTPTATPSSDITGNTP